MNLFWHEWLYLFAGVLSIAACVYIIWEVRRK